MSTVYFMLKVATFLYFGYGAYLLYVVAWRGGFDEELRQKVCPTGAGLVRQENAWLLGVLLFLAWPLLYTNMSNRFYSTFFT